MHNVQSDDEDLDQLEHFLLYEVDSDECMTLDMLDGFLHAIAIGPTTIHPEQWLPKIWGTEEMMPPMGSIDEINRVLRMVMRHLNGIIAGLEADPREIAPCWPIMPYCGRQYEDAEGWAYGFVEGMRLNWKDWKPLLDTPEGRAWFRPIGLLGELDFCPEQDKFTKTPAKRAKLALEIPDAVLNMHAFWLPLRHAIYERKVAKTLQPKVGRNEPCPCGSGKKFKKCCGAAADLH
ncbi:MAG: UPF0149 family protein [Burkholderiaceae bacterium]